MEVEHLDMFARSHTSPVCVGIGMCRIVYRGCGRIFSALTSWDDRNDLKRFTECFMGGTARSFWKQKHHCEPVDGIFGLCGQTNLTRGGQEEI